MGKDTLVVLWTSGDKETAMNMVLMYSKNAKVRGWWKDVILIVWGPSAKLAVEDEEIQAHLKAMKEAGITLEACKACADMYGASEGLEGLGIEVLYIGERFTEYLKNDYTVITI